MKILKFASAAAMSAMILASATSCTHEDEFVPASGSGSFEEQNETAINSALIAKKVVVDEDDYNLQRRVWSEEFKNFAKKITTFSNNAAVAIGAKASGNTAVSPLSVFMALSMAAESANSDTRQEILDAMGITYDELSANIQTVCYICNQSLDSRYSSNGVNMIKSVNSLWVKDGVRVKDDGIKALTTKYCADLFNMDFAETNVGKLVQSYISNETKGLLSPSMELTPETFFLLMNVVYLREIWDKEGDELPLTEQKYDFVNYDQSTTNTNLLQGYYITGKAVETEKFRKFKTTTNSGLSLTFFVPKDGYTLDDIYTSEVLNDPKPYIYEDTISNPSVNYRFHTRCFFPEYKASFDGEIQDAIKKMGVDKFFKFDSCDFSNLTDEPVFCDKIIHVTSLDVTRKGIEGAAVTVVEMDWAGDPGPSEKVWKDVYFDFPVDRNFAYVLSKDNVPIFTGVVKSIK
ncbi:MAG: hypothetical protein IKP73_10785 [Bacteroidales bacterium]|nr:hypothetical protein [Bacteroidales bacterium]